MMSFAQDGDAPRGRTHIAWADYAKGLCIVLVVMLYANDLVEHSAGRGGWLDLAVSFARPFRMPDFFLVSGVLLTLAIGRDWRTFLDRKVAHFAYFYLLWLTILVAFESPWTAARVGWPGVSALYVRSLVNPYSMLWFIYLLPIFFVVTKAASRAPIALVWLLAAVLQMAALHTGIKVMDKFAAYYVFFYSGYAFAPYALRFAEAVSVRPFLALAGLALWGALEAYLVWAGNASLPAVSLGLGLLGAAAVIAMSALMARLRIFRPLAYCGRNSLVIYIAFAIPLALASKMLFYSGWIADVGTIAALATLAAVIAPLALHRIVRGTPLRFLFERPAWFAIAPPPSRYGPARGSARAASS